MGNSEKVKVASFKDAFNYFLAYCDNSFSINSLSQFVELKEKGKIVFENEDIFWNGNHFKSESKVEMFYIKEPLEFFVVKYHHREYSDKSFVKSHTKIFVVE